MVLTIGWRTSASLDFVEQSDQGRNLWRLKSWELWEDNRHYRVVYAFVPASFRHYVLGIFPKSEFNYESDNPRTQRVLRAYSAL